MIMDDKEVDDKTKGVDTLMMTDDSAYDAENDG